jgi:hypothetical protein
MALNKERRDLTRYVSCLISKVNYHTSEVVDLLNCCTTTLKLIQNQKRWDDLYVNCKLWDIIFLH